MSCFAYWQTVLWVFERSWPTGILNRCAWMQRVFPLAPGDRVAFKTATTFVDSMWEMFGPLLAGTSQHTLGKWPCPEPLRQNYVQHLGILAGSAGGSAARPDSGRLLCMPAGSQIVIVSEHVTTDARQLAQHIAQHLVTHLTAVPRVWHALLPHLAAISAAGDASCTIMDMLHGMHIPSSAMRQQAALACAGCAWMPITVCSSSLLQCALLADRAGIRLGACACCFTWCKPACRRTGATADGRLQW